MGEGVNIINSRAQWQKVEGFYTILFTVKHSGIVWMATKLNKDHSLYTYREFVCVEQGGSDKQGEQRDEEFVPITLSLSWLKRREIQ